MISSIKIHYHGALYLLSMQLPITQAEFELLIEGFESGTAVWGEVENPSGNPAYLLREALKHAVYEPIFV